jgi:hypothetical protein
MPTAGEAIALPNFTNQNHFPELTKRSPTVPKSDTFGKANANAQSHDQNKRSDVWVKLTPITIAPSALGE